MMHKFNGETKSVTEILKLDYNELSELIASYVTQKSVVIKHPKLGIPTYLRQNKQVKNTNRLANVLYFTDEEFENGWLIVQAINFIDSYIVDGEVYSPFNHNWMRDIHNSIVKNEVYFDNRENKKFSGLLFSQTRPYHFFYDQFVNYFKLSELCNINDCSYTNEYCFYEELPFSHKLKKTSADQGCYIYPTIKANQYYGKYADQMHNFIKGASQSDVAKTEEGITVWFGITGQKRSWVEQVEGYINLTIELLKIYDSVAVNIDGMTNFINDNSTSNDDLEVFNQIKNILGKKEKCTVNSLINKTYKEKVEIANKCDLFISNNGSGSLVPHLFCGLKGVLHGDHRQNAFSNIYDDTIRVVPKQKVKSDQSPVPARASYSIHWSVMFNLLMELNGRNLRIKEQTPEPVSRLEFSSLSFRNEVNPVDALRIIALTFEKLGDTKTAYKIMEKAQELRPKGQLINKKINEYKSKLENT